MLPRRTTYPRYTVRPTEEIAFTSVKRYAYEDAGDRLLSFDGEKMVYDAVGNPTTYRGKSLTFGKGRQLNSYDCIRFTYDLRGRRQCKGDTAYYYDGDGKLLREGNYLEFIYDDTGIAGIHYCYRTYFFRKNAQGDVIALVDNSGQTVVQYVYDAWGNHLVLKPDGSENTRSDFIGNINPIRYRGYYYDKETGLYYLKSRYYDPETGRFINIDDTDYLDPDTIGGINLYAYCNNNPVMNVDPDGTMPKWLKWTLIGVAVVSAAVVAAVTMGPGVLLDGAVGAIVGIGLEFFGDLLDDGKINRGWGAYIGAGLGGFVAGLGQGFLSTVFFSGVGDVVDGVVSGTITSFNAGISAFGRSVGEAALGYVAIKGATRAIASVKYSKVVGKASENIVINKRLANAGFKNLKIGKLGESGVISGIAATYKTIEKILGYLISAGKEVVSLWTR